MKCIWAASIWSSLTLLSIVTLMCIWMWNIGFGFCTMWWEHLAVWWDVSLSVWRKIIVYCPLTLQKQHSCEKLTSRLFECGGKEWLVSEKRKCLWKWIMGTECWSSVFLHRCLCISMSDLQEFQKSSLWEHRNEQSPRNTVWISFTENETYIWESIKGDL